MIFVYMYLLMKSLHFTTYLIVHCRQICHLFSNCFYWVSCNKCLGGICGHAEDAWILDKDILHGISCLLPGVLKPSSSPELKRPSSATMSSADSESWMSDTMTSSINSATSAMLFDPVSQPKGIVQCIGHNYWRNFITGVMKSIKKLARLHIARMVELLIAYSRAWMSSVLA